MKAFSVLVLFFSIAAQAQFSEPETIGNKSFGVFSRHWYPSFYSLASVETDKAQDGGRLSTYNYFTFSSYLKGSYKFALRVPFTYATAGSDRFNGEKYNEQEWLLQDTILELRNADMAYIPGDIGLYWAGRVYAPVSKFSRDSGQIARFRNQFVFSKVFNRYFEFDYDQKFNYYFQSRKSYPNHFEDEYGFPVDTTSATKQMEYTHWLTVWGKVTPKSGLGWTLKFEDTYWNKSETEQRSRPGERLIGTGPEARFPLNDSVNFIFSYEDSVDRENNYQEFGKFLAKNTQFVLHSFVSF